MSQELETLLDRVPGWAGRSRRIEPLSGGLTNRNFLVEIEGERQVVRWLASETGHLGIDRGVEVACTRTAAELGLGPAVRHVDLDAGLLVVDFVEARPLEPGDLADPERLGRVVEAIRTLHEGPEFPGTFCPLATITSYHRRALGRGVSMPPRLEAAIELVPRLDAALAPRRRPVACHNDLLGGNLLDDGERIWIIDWEYGGTGDAFFDLGNLAVNLELDERGRDRLLELHGLRAGGADRAHLELMALVSDLRESLWGYLQSGVSTLDFDYRGYGEEHLDRFLERSGEGHLERCLAELG